MKVHLAVVAGFILSFSIASSSAAGQLVNNQTVPSNSPSEMRSPPVLDREHNNLRGPVKTSVEETTFPAVTPAEGEQIPERKGRYKTEYDLDGRILATRSHDSDGSEWITRYTYGTSGNVLKIASGKEGEARAETIYSYDDQGRLLATGDNRTPDNPVTFGYDDQGRKTAVQVSRPADRGRAAKTRRRHLRQDERHRRA